MRKLKISLGQLLEYLEFKRLTDCLMLQFKVTLTVLCLHLFMVYMGRSSSPNLITLLLLMSMSVHPNPGPVNEVLSIFHINIRSLRNKVAYLSDIASDYDVICVTETHLDEHVQNTDIEIQ